MANHHAPTMETIVKYLQNLAQNPETELEKAQVRQLEIALEDLDDGVFEKAIAYLDDRNLNLLDDLSSTLSPTLPPLSAADDGVNKGRAEKIIEEGREVVLMIRFLESLNNQTL